jgi:hypothetical protein
LCPHTCVCRQLEVNDPALWRQYGEAPQGGDLKLLQDASELAFAADSRSSYSLEEDVVLQLHTKNTGTEVRVQ